jgi:hypothetical protein
MGTDDEEDEKRPQHCEPNLVKSSQHQAVVSLRKITDKEITKAINAAKIELSSQTGSEETQADISRSASESSLHTVHSCEQISIVEEYQIESSEPKVSLGKKIVL